MNKNYARLLAVAGLLAGTSLTASSASTAAAPAAPSVPAQTAAAPDCSEGSICFYSEAGFTGKRKENPLEFYECYVPTVSWPDGTQSRAGSVYNNRGETTQLEWFDNGDCDGDPQDMLTNKEGLPSVGDEAKSWRLAPRCDLGSVCIYENADFSGKSWHIDPPLLNRCYTAGKGNWGYGYYNTTNYNATFYRSRGCGNLPYAPVPAHSFGSFKGQVHLVKLT